MLAYIAIVLLSQTPQELEKWGGVPETFTPEERAAVIAYVESGKNSQDMHALFLDEELKQLRKKIPASGTARKARLQQIKDAERDLKLYAAGVIFKPGRIHSFMLRKGQVGHLESSGTVRQVVGDTVELQISSSVNILVQDIQADDVADGKEFSVPFVVECIGTTQFKTVSGGTRTLYTFRKFPYLDKVREWEELRIASWDKSRKK